MRYLRAYFLHRTLLAQASRWLARNNADQLAARCLFHLNRHARTLRGRSEQKKVIYHLKNEAVKYFYARGFCQRVTSQVQTFECWHTHEYNWGIDGWCEKCDNTGIYRQNHLFLFHFEIGGQSYRWHQPASLVLWPLADVQEGEEEYRGPTDAQNVPLTRLLLELYTATVYAYLLAGGVPAADLPKRPLLRIAIYKQWLELVWPVTHWYRRKIYTPLWWRATVIRGTWDNLKVFWRLLQMGYFTQLTQEIDPSYLEEKEEDDIPF